MKRLAISLAALALYATSAGAADLGKPKQWGEPYRKPPPPVLVEDEPKQGEYKTHNWYVGAAAGWSWGDECSQVEYKHAVGFRCGSDNTITAGMFAGYLWRPNSVFGVGAEVDYSLRDLGTFNVGDYLASARLRGGVYVTKEIFVYGTGGYGRRGIVHADDRGGPVWGGGVEYALTKRTNMRVEALHFQHDGEFKGVPGDNDNTVLRVGVSTSLN